MRNLRAQVRAMKLPQDLDLYLDLLRKGFQYEEHPDWSLQRDEIEYLIDSINNTKRMWPVYAFLGLFSEDVRDMMHGFVCEVDGQTVGILTGQRRRGSREWYATNLVVLPEFRRQGIAPRLIEAAADFVRSREKVPTVILDVVDGNRPAIFLYKYAGFEDYSGYAEFSIDKAPPKAVLPAGYSLEPLSAFDWQTRYELDQRTTPEIVRKYTPVAESYYRKPWLMTALVNLGRFITRKKDESFVIRSQETQQVVGIASYHARLRPGGVNSLKIKIDPAHPALAPFLLALMLELIQKAGRGQRVKFQFPTWQPALLEAAEALGAKRHTTIRRMGKTFS